MVKGGRSFIAEQPRDLRKRYASFLYVLVRETLAQLVQDLLISCPLVGQFARERSPAMAQCLGDPVSLGLAVGQQLLRLVLDRSA